MKIKVVERKFSDEEIEQLKKTMEMPIVYDEDCPPITPEEAKRACRVNTPEWFEMKKRVRERRLKLQLASQAV